MNNAAEIHVPDTLQVDNLKRIMVTGFAIIGIFFVGLGLWASFAKLSGAVIASGTVKVDLNRKVVQHREGGIVKEILVREGDQVKAGQPLMVLHDSAISATANMVGNQLAQMLARKARLEAQRDGKPTIAWPSELEQMKTDPEVRQAIASEQDVFQTERQGLEGQTRLLQEQITGLRAQVQAEDRIIQAFQEELAAKQELMTNRYLEKSPVWELERNLANHQAIRSVTQQKIAETSMRINEMRKESVQKATAMLADVQSKISDLRDRQLPTEEAKERLVVSAPVAGTVMDMTTFSVGAVVRPGDRLMDIVPKEQQLIVEGEVQVKDIAKVHVGQEARIQLAAFSQAEASPFDAKVIYVSPDRTTIRVPQGEMPVYKIQAEIPKEELEKQNITMSAGMPATVFIATKERSIMSYLMEPITEKFSHALRE